MDLEQNLARGVRANEVLENEIYIEAFELIKQEIYTTWQQSPARDAEARETLYLMLKLMDKLKATMQSVMETGKLASLEMDYQKSKMQRVKETLLGDW